MQQSHELNEAVVHAALQRTGNAKEGPVPSAAGGRGAGETGGHGDIEMATGEPGGLRASGTRDWLRSIGLGPFEAALVAQGGVSLESAAALPDGALAAAGLTPGKR